MDHIDAQIIAILSKHSRTPFLRIAKELDLSESTVRKRVAALEKKKVIESYSLVTNSEKMGYHTVVLMGVDVEPDHYVDVAGELQKMDEAVYVCTSAGDHNFMMKLVTKDTQHLTEVSHRLRQIPGVRRICPAIVKEPLKGSL